MQLENLKSKIDFCDIEEEYYKLEEHISTLQVIAKLLNENVEYNKKCNVITDSLTLNLSQSLNSLSKSLETDLITIFSNEE